MQKYVASTKSDLSGWYIVEKWNIIQQQYFPEKGEEYPTEEQAKERARELNDLNKEENKNGGEK